MRKLLVAVALITSLCSTAIAGPKEEALQVLEKWTKAFTDSDVDGIVKLYAPDALFLGTGSKTVVTKPEGIRTYFEQAFLRIKPPGANLGDHGFWRERFDHVVHRAVGVPLENVLLLAADRRHKDDWRVARAFALADQRRRFETVELGHLNVEKDQRALLFEEKAKRFAA